MTGPLHELVHGVHSHEVALFCFFFRTKQKSANAAMLLREDQVSMSRRWWETIKLGAPDDQCAESSDRGRCVAVAHSVSLQLKPAEMMDDTRNVDMKREGRDRKGEREV